MGYCNFFLRLDFCNIWTEFYFFVRDNIKNVNDKSENLLLNSSPVVFATNRAMYRKLQRVETHYILVSF